MSGNIYPVNMTIQYSSGRIQKQVLKSGYQEWKKDLARAKELGSVISYELETSMDRSVKKLSGG